MALAGKWTLPVDVALIALLMVVIGIIATGGGTVAVGSTTLRAHRVDNEIWILTALIVVRYAFGRGAPFLGRRNWPLEWLLESGVTCGTERCPQWLFRVFASPARALAVVSALAIGLKLWFAWQSPGFFSGDDVEIHEMSTGFLLGRDWPVWHLRNPFFPLLFIYPAQRAAVALGGSDPQSLVFAGRAVVAVISTVAIPLTWLAARRLAPADPRIAALAVVFLFINKLFISFGSSELPRPVSTVFVIAAFVCVLSPGLRSTAAAGVLLGIGAVFRFSEGLFVPAALLTLPRDRLLLRAAILLFAASLTFVAVSATADAAYWGTPFTSVTAIIDYTLIERQSSRGYEPSWAYLLALQTWTTFFFLALAVAGSHWRHAESWWLWTPLLLLSLLPHKESRYLVPIVPFLAIATARGFVRVTDWMRTGVPIKGWQISARELFAPMFLLAILHEAGGWRLMRSDEGVRLAQYLRSSAPSGLAAQDVWRLGGRAHLPSSEPLLELPAAVLEDDAATARILASVEFVALRSRTARTTGDRVLPRFGFTREPGWRGEDYVLYTRRPH